MSEPLVLREDTNGVTTLTLNRPEKRNALSHPLRGALLDALVAADVDDGIRVTIVRGAGSCFSAGYDLAPRLLPGLLGKCTAREEAVPVSGV